MNGKLALLSGDPYCASAARAKEIAALTVREKFFQAEIGRCFPLAGGDIPGEEANNGIDQTEIAEEIKRGQL